jgi:GTP cyclohydrolase IA
MNNGPSDFDAREAVKTLLRYMGEDPEREGLLDTPDRVVRAWEEMTSGYRVDPEEILETNFDAARYNEVIACAWIEFYSTCEHHMLPFSGYAHIGYMPARKEPRVVGLSKMARLVECYGRRLQIQEKMTVEIADAMQKYIRPSGVAVVIQAKHLCMSCRGVQKHKAAMVTSEMRGMFRKSAATRSEFFRLVDLAAKHNGQ